MRIAKPISNALRLSVVEGSFFGIYWNILLIIIVNGMLVVFEANPLQFAILNALPLLSQVFGVPAAKLIQEKDIRKPFCLISDGISRASWLLLLFVFILPDNDMLKVWFIIGVSVIGHTTHSGGAVSWLSWVSDLVPEEIRGVYFGVRGAITGLIGMIGLTLVSIWADRYRIPFEDLLDPESDVSLSMTDIDRAGQLFEAKEEYLHVIWLMVFISVFFALVSWVLLVFQPVRKMKKLINTGYKAIWETLTSEHGKRIAIVWLAIFFATGVTTGIYIQFFLNRLGMSWTGITAYIWVVMILSTILTPLLGRFSDRFGYRLTLLIAWGGIWWQPLLSVFTPNDAVHLLGLLPLTILIDAIAGGIFWPAVGITQNNIVIAETPSETRAGFFAVLTAIGGIIGFGAAALAGWMATEIGPDVSYNFGWITLDNLRIPMVIGAVLRLVAWLLIFIMREPPRQKGQVTSVEAFTAVWKILTGKPVGGRLR